MKIKTFKENEHNILFGIIAGLLILIGILSYSIFKNASDMYAIENNRFKLFALGLELKEGSDNLTKFSRTYVLTGDTIWENRYWDLLDIRNGRLPWPNGRIITLQDSIKKLGISKNEFELLKTAEKKSNDLVWIEEAAFNALRGLFADTLKQFTIKLKPDTLFAQNILFDKE